MGLYIGTAPSFLLHTHSFLAPLPTTAQPGGLQNDCSRANDQSHPRLSRPIRLLKSVLCHENVTLPSAPLAQALLLTSYLQRNLSRSLPKSSLILVSRRGSEPWKAFMLPGENRGFLICRHGIPNRLSGRGGLFRANHDSEALHRHGLV